MLESWSVDNFKSIASSGAIALEPVTVITGVNSSGKTSLLQSLLMTAQTVGSRLVDQPVIFNERLVQLGTFEDVLRRSSEHRTLQIGGTLRLLDEQEEEIWPFDENDDFYTIVQKKRFTVSFSVVFRGPEEVPLSAIDASRVWVERASIAVTVEDLSAMTASPPAQQTFSYELLSPEDLALFLQQVRTELRRLAPITKGQSGYRGTFHSASPQPPLPPYLLSLVHFLPGRFVRKVPERERLEENLSYDLHRLLFGHRSPAASLAPELAVPFPESVVATLRALCASAGISSPMQATSLLSFLNWVDSLDEPQRELFTHIADSKILPNLFHFFLTRRPDEPSEILEQVNSDAPDGEFDYLDRAIARMTQFFSQSVRYLGPLRADPKLVQQQFAPTGNLDDVGVNGEYAATVFHYNRLAPVSFYHPETREVVEAPLQDALDTWVRYLQVAHQVRAESAGPSGMAWSVAVQPEQPLLLSQVGVGTSQILPLLVLGLLSPAGSVLVIEQPELHLHPNVQALLADFFLGLAQCQKQCVIETHSEYLISRLRLHIVQSGGQEQSGCAIYFAQQDTRGITTFEAVSISERGNILNWPEGFFDTGVQQLEDIASASLSRQQRRRHDERDPD